MLITKGQRIMIINLIKANQMFSLTLPQKIKGQYWITDVDENAKPRNLISIEALQNEWVVKSNKNAFVLDSSNQRIDNTVLKPLSFFNIKIKDSDERVILFAETIDESRQTFKKVLFKEACALNIGRTRDNDIFYENKFVSGKHAKLSYNNGSWSIIDTDSTNGTYVNGYRVKSQNLFAGDLIYIMGLKIIIGHNFLAINNPDNLITLQSNKLIEYKPQEIDNNVELSDIPEKDYFFRSPRFHREIEHSEITIDPPPQIQKGDTVPMALMLGPSLTMGLTSMSTGIISVMNIVNSGGQVSSALPTLLMSFSMLLGTVLWPILTKKYEKKQRIKNENKRQIKYLAYLDSIRDEIKRKCKEQSDILNENLITPEECSNRIAESKVELWERSKGQSDFLSLRLGIGELSLDADVKFPEKKFSMENDSLQDAMLSLGSEPKLLHNIPISLSLVENKTVGIYGDYSYRNNLLKSLILQTVALHGYDEVKLMLLVDYADMQEWEFVKFIPHFWNNEKTVRYLATNADDIKELSSYIDKNILVRKDDDKTKIEDYSTYYIIISTSKKLSEKCESLQKLLKYKNNCGFSIVMSEPNLKDLPKETKSVVFANGEQSKIFDRDDTTGQSLSFVQDKMNEATLLNLSEDIANIELDLGGQNYVLPNMITFLEMFNVSKIEHLNPLTRWKENNPTITLQTPVGVDAYGETFNLDLHEKYHGPHGLVAGMTGSGKSEFIITYILSLAVNYHPDEVAFILIDYKGGGLTGAFEDSDRGIKLPHLAGTITNLDGAAVKRSLISIQSELRRRQAIFNEARKISNEGTMDIYTYQQLYRDKIVTEPVPHLFIISDEFAELKTQQPEFMEQLISTARIGRSLGVHLILATQKPSGVVDDQIWSNSKFRVCLKVQDKADSQDMIKRPDAAELSQTGRFYLQVGFNEFFALGQSAWCGAEYIPTETVEKSVDNSIQIVDNLGRVMMNVKPAKKKTSGTKVKQVVSIVKYLSDLAKEEKISVRPLWLDPIPEIIVVDEVKKKYGIENKGTYINPVVGEYDDPFNQKQCVLTVPFSDEGNCLIYGSTGNGKTTFLTTLTYSLIENHSADEVNIYIMDFGSETLKMFEKAPQVGGVVTSADEEKTINLLKMLNKEIDVRKNLFAEYGGDYTSYCRNSGKIVPNIIVLINNFAGFSEQYEELLDVFNLISRDGVKYGIYFAVTANNANAVRYRTAQNFKMIYTMQLNDASDYSLIVGKTDGLVPSKYKGRGLVKLDNVYEFQTARCCESEDNQDFIRTYCKELVVNATSKARRIPVLPEKVDYEYIKDDINGYSDLPIGVAKKALNLVSCNLGNKVVFPIVAQESSFALSFADEFIKVLSAVGKVGIYDSEQAISFTKQNESIENITDAEQFVKTVFAEMVERNNTYKDSNMSLDSLNKYDEKIYVIVGLKLFYDRLTDDGKEKFKVMMEKAETYYKIHFVIVESLSQFNGYSYDPWFKRTVPGTDGLWIGDGVADQYLLKVGKITNTLYEEIGNDFGYFFNKGKLTLIKLLSSADEED